MDATATRPTPPRPWYSILYLQVLVAITLGIALGVLAPQTGAAMKPLGDAFVALIRMMIAPVIFCTVVHGIATMGDLSRVGRVGLRRFFISRSSRRWRWRSAFWWATCCIPALGSTSTPPS